MWRLVDRVFVKEKLPDLTCELCIAGISKAKRNALNWPDMINPPLVFLFCWITNPSRSQTRVAAAILESTADT